MQKLFTNAVLSLCMAFMASCQSTDLREQDIVAQGARQVVGNELLTLHGDKTFYGRFADTGSPWTEYHYPDGRVIFRTRSRPEPGTWSVSDNQVCYSYDWNAGNDPFCFLVYENSGLFYHVDANGDDVGVVSNLIEVRPGDPEGLAD